MVVVVGVVGVASGVVVVDIVVLCCVEIGVGLGSFELLGLGFSVE